jgi:hypothetical protein
MDRRKIALAAGPISGFSKSENLIITEQECAAAKIEEFLKMATRIVCWNKRAAVY